ncbi:MAG: GDP-mannose 4,6-dehydratase [Patescibacteria group bacterium]
MLNNKILKKALITGITGQDAAYLSELLLSEGYEVYGGVRRGSDRTNWRLKRVGVYDKIKIIDFDLSEYTNLFESITKIQPDEIYNLAAQSFVGTSFIQPMVTSDINYFGTLRILDILRVFKPETKFYQASTSEMFGKVHDIPQKETTFFHPKSPYAVAKLGAHWLAINYRESYNMFVTSGILFNHESPLRGEEFVSRKISLAVAKIKKGEQDHLEIGNMYAKRDWGYAKDYVQAMYKMMQHSVPDTFVIATGETHSIKEFIEKAFQVVDIEIAWEGDGVDEVGKDVKTGKILITVNPQFYRPNEVDFLLGNATKAKTELGWEAKVKFDKLVEIMVKADLDGNGS